MQSFAMNTEKSSSGNRYARSQFLDPSVGRFNRLDPFYGELEDPLSFNKYLYVHANPIVFSDPTGMYALGTSFAASTFGAQLNKMTGEAGQFVMESFRRKQVAWDIAAWSLAGSFGLLGMATTKGVTNVLGKHAQEAIKRMPYLAIVFRTIGRLPSSLIKQITLHPNVQRAILRINMFGKHGFSIFGKASHHLVPLEALKEFPELMKRAAKGGFNINGLQNGKLLQHSGTGFSQELFDEGFRHFNNHPVYNQFVKKRLGRIADAIAPNTPNVEIAKKIEALAEKLSALIDSGKLIVK